MYHLSRSGQEFFFCAVAMRSVFGSESNVEHTNFCQGMFWSEESRQSHKIVQKDSRRLLRLETICRLFSDSSDLRAARPWELLWHLFWTLGPNTPVLGRHGPNPFWLSGAFLLFPGQKAWKGSFEKCQSLLDRGRPTEFNYSPFSFFC